MCRERQTNLATMLEVVSRWSCQRKLLKEVLGVFEHLSSLRSFHILGIVLEIVLFILEAYGRLRRKPASEATYLFLFIVLSESFSYWRHSPQMLLPFLG
jgi:hypothetical protein